MNKKQKIIVSITGIFIVLLALVGLTYAYFLTQIRGNEETKSISVTTANLILEYTDGNGFISLNNAMPGDLPILKTFAVTNRGNETVENYKVYLENVQNQLEIKDDLIYIFSCTQVRTSDYEVWEQSTDPNKKIYDLETVGTCYGGDGTLTFPSVMSVIGTNTIEPGYTQYYALKVRYMDKDYDQSVDMNKTVSAKVNIYDGKTKFLSTEIINNTTLNKTNNSTTGTLYTLPNALPTKIAEEINGENEKVLSYTLDDLGTSYFYRGNVNDNYVNFAGMCWRIVRIEGDGSVKLILEDQYTTCDDTTDSDGEGTDDYAYTGNWSIGVGNYGFKTRLNGDVTQNIISYIQPVEEADKSMAKAFYDFQNTFATNELRKMKAGNWCPGDKAYTREGTKPYTYSAITSLDYTLSMHYDSWIRLIGDNIEGYLPTLKCNGSILNNFESVTFNEEEIIKESPMYVGAITADEAVYAGATRASTNDKYYLYDGTKSAFSISYSNLMMTKNDYVFTLKQEGNIFTYPASLGSNFRPVISLVSNVNVTTKTDVADLPGTINNPYVIN